MTSRPLFISLLLSPLFPGVAAVAKAQVCLVSHGEPRAVVVTADRPTNTAAYAAEELVRHLKRATCVGLDVVEESELPPGVPTRVFVGESKAAAENGIDVARLGREAYFVRSHRRSRRPYH